MPESGNRISQAIGLTEEEVDVLLDLFRREGANVAPRHVDTARALFPRLRTLKRNLQELKHPELRNASPTDPKDQGRTD